MFNIYLFTIVCIYQHDIDQCQCNEWQKGHYTEYAQPNEPLQPLTTDTVGRHINGQDKTTPDINRHIKHIKHILNNTRSLNSSEPFHITHINRDKVDIITSSHQIPQFFGAFP